MPQSQQALINTGTFLSVLLWFDGLIYSGSGCHFLSLCCDVAVRVVKLGTHPVCAWVGF